MVLSYNDSFEVTWTNPEDAKEHWRSLVNRFPTALPYLNQEVLTLVWDKSFGPLGGRLTWANGYAFSRDESAMPTLPEEVRTKEVGDVWFNDYQVRIRDMAEDHRSRQYDSLPTEDLAIELSNLCEETAKGFLYTMRVVAGMNAPTYELVRFCEHELGQADPGLTAVLLQGFSNRSTSAAEGLADLADFAALHPELEDALGEGSFVGLEWLDGGPEFLKLLGEYLDEYGWRLENWGLLHQPTWYEEPERALRLIARLSTVPSSNGSERAAEQREQATAEIESRLTYEKRGQLRALVAKAQDHVAISESRAYWQLTLLGSLRTPALAMGRRLVDLGTIQEGNDIWHLTLDEVQAAATGSGQSIAGLVAERSANLRRWEKLTPPAYLGAPPPERSAEMAALSRLFLGVGAASVEGQTIEGQAASAGVVRGRARILRNLDDLDLLEIGDILVCQLTSPPWTPLFSIAGGVVTDTGGVLSHTAICAREAAIPCVVATQVSTSTIPDGAMITVDGSKGTVVIEG